MTTLSVDSYVPGSSSLHRWDPRFKLISLLTLMFAFATVQHLTLVPAMAILSLGLYATARLPLGLWRQRLSYPGLLILGLVLVLPFSLGPTVIWQWGGVALRQEGLAATALMAGRFLSILTLGLILLATTPFLSLLQAMRSLGLPAILTDMTLLTYRYLYETADTLATMQRAMQLRGFGQGPQAWLRLNRQALEQRALLAGNLLIRSYEQSERVYRAMRLRGYGQGRPGRPGGGGKMQAWAPHWGLTIAVLAVALGLMMAEVALHHGYIIIGL
jgi:cobalt/nickel transport system permease protein